MFKFVNLIQKINSFGSKYGGILNLLGFIIGLGGLVSIILFIKEVVEKPLFLVIILLIFLLGTILFFIFNKRKRLLRECTAILTSIKSCEDRETIQYIIEFLNTIRNASQSEGAERLITYIGKRTVADLHVEDGEILAINEYIDILMESLKVPHLSQCIFIARTKPSDWYIHPTDPPELVAIKRMLVEYLNLQREKRIQNNVSFSRYIVLDRNMWERDPQHVNFITWQNRQGINIYFCEKNNYPVGTRLMDRAVFIKDNGKGWIIESPDFDEDIIKKYMDNNLPLHIKVKIEFQQDAVNNWLRHYLTALNNVTLERDRYLISN